MATPGPGRTVRVGKDGRVVLPQRVVADARLSPGDLVRTEDVRLRRAGMSRRAFLRRAGGLVLFLASTAETATWTSQEVQSLATRGDRARSQRLDTLLGPRGGQSVALVPAANHPFRPPITATGFYPIETGVCVSYARSLLDGVRQVRQVRGFPNVRPDDHVVLVGSQVSNLPARALFGNPWDPEPALRLDRGDWQVDLAWNIAVAGPATFEVRQYGGPWEESHQVVVEAGGGTREPTFTQGRLTEDLLLVTVLPRRGTGLERVVSLAGAHGPGTEASKRLLEHPDAGVLDGIARDVRPDRNPYYQALLAVTVEADAAGEGRPSALRYVAAHPLDVRFA